MATKNNSSSVPKPSSKSSNSYSEFEATKGQKPISKPQSPVKTNNKN